VNELSRQNGRKQCVVVLEELHGFQEPTSLLLVSERASSVSELLSVILGAGFKSATGSGSRYTVGEWREVIRRTLVEVHEEGDKTN
jgi:hypothetical protein